VLEPVESTMRTRATRAALAAAMLLVVAAVVSIGLRRPPSTEPGPRPFTSAPGVSSGGVDDSASRPSGTSPVGSAELAERAPEPAALPSQEDSPDLYATGTPAGPAEARSGGQLEAPTSPGPQLLDDPAPALSPYESPTDSGFVPGTPQSPAGDPYDQAPTASPLEVQAAPYSDPATVDRDLSPTEAPPD
jgi:hypothetical protein